MGVSSGEEPSQEYNSKRLNRGNSTGKGMVTERKRWAAQIGILESVIRAGMSFYYSHIPTFQSMLCALPNLGEDRIELVEKHADAPTSPSSIFDFRVWKVIQGPEQHH